MSGTNDVEAMVTSHVAVVPAMCRFHGGWGFGNGGANEFPLKRFFSYASVSSLHILNVQRSLISLLQ